MSLAFTDVVGSAEDAINWYVAGMGDFYNLDQQGDDLRFIGRRTLGDVGLGVTVHTVPSLGEVPWNTTLTDPADVAPWDGPVAVARASSG